MSPDDQQAIIALRVVIARAAAPDALVWWQDESLTDAGLVLAGRLFPLATRKIALQMAMRAARTRHNAALDGVNDAIHLFDLGGELELELDAALAEREYDIPARATSIGALADQLEAAGVVELPSIVHRSGSNSIQISSGGLTEPLALARVLAAGYLHGAAAQPVFPFVKRRQGT
jgi:hypothetical protein